MSKVISIVNRKGGVGKTSLTIALAETLVFEHRKNVAILDFDPQASISEILLSPDEYGALVESGRTLGGFLRAIAFGQPTNLSQCVVHARHTLKDRGLVDMALLSNTPELWDLELDCVRAHQEDAYQAAVKSLIDKVRLVSDIILIDCPPGRTLSAEQGIISSDLILCPVIPDRLSIWGMERMRQYFDQLARSHDLPPWRFIISQYDKASKSARRQLDVIRKNYGDQLISASRLIPIGDDNSLIVDSSNVFPERIELFKAQLPVVRTLEQFYGKDVTQQLRKITKTILAELNKDA